MSHYSVAVLTRPGGKTVDELLEPYNENIKYAPYIFKTKKEAIESVRKDIYEYAKNIYYEYLKDPEKYKAEHPSEAHIFFLEKEFSQRLIWTDEECYEYAKQLYGEHEIDTDGNLLSTYNPNSKWDWYIIGGRWTNMITLKDGTRTNQAVVKSIDFSSELRTYAVLTPDGIWHEPGKMLMFGVSEASDEEYKKWMNETYEKIIKTADSEWTMTIVDCHI